MRSLIDPYLRTTCVWQKSKENSTYGPEPEEEKVTLRCAKYEYAVPGRNDFRIAGFKVDLFSTMSYVLNNPEVKKGDYIDGILIVSDPITYDLAGKYAFTVVNI